MLRLSGIINRLSAKRGMKRIMPGALSNKTSQSRHDDKKLLNLIRKHAIHLPELPSKGSTKSLDFGRKFDRYGDCRVLLLGDASHGTSEFYTARAEITKYLVANHGFNIVAVEADWPDAESIDRYVRRRPTPGVAEGVDVAFSRFPTWMWRNTDVVNFVEWLREHNKGKHLKAKEAVGCYGMDLYSMGTSMNAVVAYLDRVDPKKAEEARKAYAGLMRWADDPYKYGVKSLSTTFKGYEKEVVKLLRGLLAKRLEYSSHHANGEEFHGGEQNAWVVAGECAFVGTIFIPSNGPPI